MVSSSVFRVPLPSSELCDYTPDDADAMVEPRSALGRRIVAEVENGGSDASAARPTWRKPHHRAPNQHHALPLAAPQPAPMQASTSLRHLVDQCKADLYIGTGGGLLTSGADDPLQPLRAIVSAPEFIDKAAIPRSFSKKPEICLNADCAPGTALHTKFVEACRRHSDRNVEIVFHGTDDSNISAILRNGLDPSLRGTAHGQAFGPGEYFARNVQCALGYSHPKSKHDSTNVSRSVIVCAVLTTSQGDHERIVVVSESDCHIPLALLSYGEQTSEQSKATRLRALAQVAIQKAEQAEAASIAAVQEANEACSFANVCQHLIRGELTEAIGLYDSATRANRGQPPDWSPDLVPYLAHFSIAERDAWFPGATSKKTYFKPTEHAATTATKAAAKAMTSNRRGHFYCANGRTVDEMRERAQAKCDEASRLRTEADLRDADAKDAEAKAKVTKKKLAASSAPQGPPGATQVPAPLSSQVPQPLLVASTPSAHTSVSFPMQQQPTAGATRRILHELRRLKTNCDEMLDVTLVDDSDCYTWRVDLKMDQSTTLGRELHSLTAQAAEPTGAVQLEVTFNGGYPATPPFVRVVSPRFQFHTGHVTVGGSICLQELTTSGWSPEMTVHGLMHLIRSALVEGDGRLDPTRAHVPYAAAEAREAFARVARAHGWQ